MRKELEHVMGGYQYLKALETIVITKLRPINSLSVLGQCHAGLVSFALDRLPCARMQDETL